MTGLRALDELAPDDARWAGGKAYNCARLKQAGFPVPDGLVVPATASEPDFALLTHHEWFDRFSPDVLFAVRSSGIGEDGQDQSFAGIHETRLNVRRGDVYDAVVACRASAQSTQALAYRRAQGLSTDSIETAVLVQQMVQARAAGVAFTINPLTHADELVVNASWGLGEALVSGLVDPDEFRIAKKDGALLSSRIGDKGSDESVAASSGPSITPSQVRELGAILLAIERHYGAPQDVEWCQDGARFWIVQSRPITSIRGRAVEIEWTRANLAEVLPDLASPQVVDAYEAMLNVAERRFMGKLIAPDAELGPMVRAFHGRLYFNLSQLRRVCMMAGAPAAAVLRSMGHDGEIRPEDEKPLPVPAADRLRVLPDLVRTLGRHLRANWLFRQHEARMRERLDRWSAVQPRTLSDTELWSTLESTFRQAPDDMQVVFVFSGVVFYEGPVRAVCDKVGFPFERLVYPQLAAGERSVSAQQAFDLLALASTARKDPRVVECLSGEPLALSALRHTLQGTAFLAQFEGFLDEYGHRGRYESDWALPRYRDDPAPLLFAVRAHLEGTSGADPSVMVARQEREAAEAWQAFDERLSGAQRRIVKPGLRWAIGRIKQYYLWRERCRSDLTKLTGMLRGWHLVLAGRFVERGWLDRREQYFLLLLGEVAAAVQDVSRGPSLRAIAIERAAELERLGRLHMPLLMRESELPGLIRASGVSHIADDDDRLTGLPVSGGVVEAEVVVMRDPGDFGRMKRGAILVARATDPSWTPLFTLASGVIVEVGGVLSHASTIAREYGLPALANVKHATRRLKTGDRVKLDATNGVVTRLPTSQPAAAASVRSRRDTSA